MDFEDPRFAHNKNKSSRLLNLNLDIHNQLATLFTLSHFSCSIPTMKASSIVSAMALKYFDIAGRAEPIRILFHIAGVQYDDVRIPFKEWPDVKETTPLGFVPVLTIDGQDFCQSISLTRYAAKLAGWYPESEVDALKADMIAETVNELSGQAPRVS